jgi:hypothetical protein
MFSTKATVYMHTVTAHTLLCYYHCWYHCCYHCAHTTPLQVAVVWPWEIEFDRLTGEFTVPIPDNLHQLSSATSTTATATADSSSSDTGGGGNCYRLQLYVRDDCSSIPYSEAMEGLVLPGPHDVSATAVALLCYTDSAAAAAAAAAAAGATGAAQRCLHAIYELHGSLLLQRYGILALC